MTHDVAIDPGQDGVASSMRALPHEERPVALATVGVTKRFPGVLAVAEASITVRSGEIHALVGENGAGKSTLIKIITGNYRPDHGQVVVNGDEVSFHSARDSIEAGIAAVHQERNLVSRFTGGENIMLEQIPRRGRFFVDTGKTPRGGPARPRSA